jgi:hypothetical protein
MLVSLLASLTAISTASIITWVMQGHIRLGLIVTPVQGGVFQVVTGPEVSVASPIAAGSITITSHRRFDTRVETVERVAGLVDFPMVSLIVLAHWVLGSLKGRYQRVGQELLKRTKLGSPVLLACIYKLSTCAILSP